jgi:hypothetical protein
VDSHELIALCAPRPVFLSAGNGPGPVAADGTFQANDAWIDGKGSFLAAVGAGPVYRLLGKKDLGATEFLPIDTPIIGGDIGFKQQHTGGHTPGPTWSDLHHLRGASTSRSRRPRTRRTTAVTGRLALRCSLTSQVRAPRHFGPVRPS